MTTQSLPFKLGLLLSMMLVCLNRADAATLISNGGFEEDVVDLPEDQNFKTLATDWTIAGSAGTFNPTEGSGGTDSFNTDQVGDTIVAWANPLSSLRQNLTGTHSTLTSGITYHVTARVGSRRENGGNFYHVNLYHQQGGGRITLRSHTQNDTALNTAEFVTVNFSYEATSDGGPLGVFLFNSGAAGQIAFDDVQVTAQMTPVPEPMTYGLISGLTLLAFGHLRTRKNRYRQTKEPT